jgi:type IV pilus assembly protein PilA
MSEATTMAGSAKAAVSEYFISTGALPTGNNTAGITTTMDASSVVDTVTWNTANNAILITLEATYTPGDLAGSEEFVLAVTNTDDSGVTWDCNTSNAAVTTPVPSQYLPANCR